MGEALDGCPLVVSGIAPRIDGGLLGPKSHDVVLAPAPGSGCMGYADGL